MSGLLGFNRVRGSEGELVFNPSPQKPEPTLNSNSDHNKLFIAKLESSVLINNQYVGGPR